MGCPFWISIRNGDVIEVRKMLESDNSIIDQEDCQGRTPLMEAICCDNEEIAMLLIEFGANINKQDNNGWSALHFAAQESLVSIVKLLTKGGAIVDLKDINGNTALFRAIFSPQDSGDVISLLISAGADSGLKNNYGVSPYELAKQVTNYNLLQFFE